MAQQRLDLSIANDVARIILTRGQVGNAIDLVFARELEDAASHCLASQVRVVYITATGPQFCTGGDLKSFANESDLPSHLAEVTSHLHAGIATLVEMDAPVVAAVRGAVAGAGLGIVCAADVVVAAKSSTFLMAYTRLALTPDGSTSWFLPRHLGLRRALDMTITNRILDSDEALDWGLVSRVVADDQVLDEASMIVESLATGPTAAYGAAARLLRSAAFNPLGAQLDSETANIVARANSADAREGLQAFLEHRRPAFNGE